MCEPHSFSIQTIMFLGRDTGSYEKTPYAQSLNQVTMVHWKEQDPRILVRISSIDVSNNWAYWILTGIFLVPRLSAKAIAMCTTGLLYILVHKSPWIIRHFFTESLDICVFHLVKQPQTIQNHLKLFLLFHSNLPMCIAPSNSSWLLRYTTMSLKLTTQHHSHAPHTTN